MSKKINKKIEQFVWGGLHPFSYHPFVFNFIPDLRNKIIMDLGCGKGIWGYLIRTVRPLGTGKLVGLDINKKYLEFVKKHNVYDKLIVGNITEIPIKDSSLDFIICSEVIEHLSKNKGRKFLNEVDRVMRTGGRVIITTPNANIDTHIREGADSHDSLWSMADFKDKGYRVFGIGFKIHPGYNRWYTSLLHALSYFLTPITFKFPTLSGFLIAVKDY